MPYIHRRWVGGMAAPHPFCEQATLPNAVGITIVTTMCVAKRRRLLRKPCSDTLFPRTRRTCKEKGGEHDVNEGKPCKIDPRGSALGGRSPPDSGLWPGNSPRTDFPTASVRAGISVPTATRTATSVSVSPAGPRALARRNGLRAPRRRGRAHGALPQPYRGLRAPDASGRH